MVEPALLMITTIIVNAHPVSPELAVMKVSKAMVEHTCIPPLFLSCKIAFLLCILCISTKVVYSWSCLFLFQHYQAAEDPPQDQQQPQQQPHHHLSQILLQVVKTVRSMLAVVVVS